MSLASMVQKQAQAALGRYGAPATLTHATPGAFDPATGTVTSTTTTASVRALLDASSLQGLGFKFGQDLVQGGDMKATVAGVIPEPGDTLAMAMGTFTVIAVRPSYVGDQAVMCECLVRK